MSWDDRRTLARAGSAARQLAHSDDAKHRSDERTHLAHRRPKVRSLTAVAVGLAVVVIGGGAAAALVATRGGNDAATGSARPAGHAANPPTPTPTHASSAAAETLASGVTFQGRTVFNTRVTPTGTSRVVVTCDPDCDLEVESSAGHNEVMTTWVEAALAHQYSGSGSRQSFVGSPMTQCNENDPWSNPDRWSTRLTMTKDRLVLRAVMAGFQGDNCFTTRTTLTFTGSPTT